MIECKAKNNSEKITLSEAIERFCEENDYSFREDYSGRGMFGDQCVGIVVGALESYKVVAELVQELIIYYDFDDPAHSLGNIRSDSMGLDMIIYFPSIKYEGNKNED